MIVLNVFLYLAFFALVVVFALKKEKLTDYEPIILGGLSIVTFVQLELETMRWQFYPLYVGILVLGALISIRHFHKKSLPTFVRRILIGLSGTLLIVSMIAYIVFPMYEIPTPSGEYLIGTDVFVMEDTSRSEEYSDDVEYRKIAIQVWYPAETTVGHDPVPWLYDGLPVARALAIDNYLPAFALDHTVNILSNSYYQAPINTDKDQYPIVIISHGWRGFRNLHTDFAEELASHGYIVVSIDHTYGSVATVFGEDDIAYLNLDALPLREENPDFLEDANQLVNTYAEDIETTLNALEDWNNEDTSSMFYGHLDLSTIGLVGHSTGGGAITAVALVDDRIDAIIGLDAWVEPLNETERLNTLDVPSLFLRSGTWEVSYNNENLYQIVTDSDAQSSLYQIDGTTHYDFSMVYMYSPLTGTLGLTGDVEGRYLARMLSDMIYAFFDDTLIQGHEGTIDVSRWPEIQEVEIP